MTERGLHERIADQFSYRGRRADVWRGLDLVLDTEAFLNLGYSKWYQPHVLGSPQRRLATKVGTGLAARLESPAGGRLLDVGCGRGGPAVHLAATFGFDVTGIDLVPYNVAAARDNADRRGVPAAFVVGDATRLPFPADAFGAAAAVDSVVYVPDKDAVYEELARVVRPGGVVGVSDLVARDGVGPAGRRAVDAFAAAWDMPPLSTLGEYRDHLTGAGLTVADVTDVSAGSVGRFGKWARLYIALAEHAGGVVERALGRWDLDADRITEQVRAAEAALPYLRHVVVYARN